MFKLLRRILLTFVLLLGAIIAEYHYSERSKAAKALDIATQRMKARLESGTRVLNLSDLPHLRELPKNLADQPKWVQINLNNTNIISISALQDVRELDRLSIRNTRIRDLSPLQEKVTILSLDIGNTLVEELSTIEALEGLERLDIGSNSIRSLEPVTKARRLNWLNLHSSYAFDGSKSHLDALQRRTGIEVFHGNAFKQNYVPGIMYKLFAAINKSWRRFELDRIYERITRLT